MPRISTCSLPLGPLQVHYFVGVVEPCRGAVLDPQWIREQPHHEPEGKQDDHVHDGQDYARLKVANFLGQAGPCCPEILESLPHWICHGFDLEKRVNEWCDH